MRRVNKERRKSKKIPLCQVQHRGIFVCFFVSLNSRFYFFTFTDLAVQKEP